MGESWPIQYQHDFALALQNRGVMKGDIGDDAGAISDHEVALAIMIGIHNRVGEGDLGAIPGLGRNITDNGCEPSISERPTGQESTAAASGARVCCAGEEVAWSGKT
jgi:hypothetical protein